MGLDWANDPIHQIATKVLSEEGLSEVEDLLVEDEFERAKAYVLGAIDRVWQDGNLIDAEAREYYKALGVPAEEAALLRQNSKVRKD